MVCFLFHLKHKILTKEIVLEWRTSKGKCPVIVIGEITNIEISGVIWGWFVCVCVCVCVCVFAQLCLTLCDPWTLTRQALLSMGFSRQEYWSRLLFPTPGDLSDPEIEPVSPALAGTFFMTSTTWKAQFGD